jgi:hypothetical protein
MGTRLASTKAEDGIRVVEMVVLTIADIVMCLTSEFDIILLVALAVDFDLHCVGVGIADFINDF